MWFPSLLRSLKARSRPAGAGPPRRPAAGRRRPPFRLAVAPLEERSLPSGFSTYLGGSEDDMGWGIAVDAAGNSYVVGGTQSADFPVTVGSYDANDDVYVAKLGPDGMLVWATLYSSNDYEFAVGIAVDGSGNLYVTGATNSTDFPTTAGAFQTAYGGGSYDGFVMKLSADTGSVLYSTYVGGTGYERPYGIAVDAFGNAYITGETDSTDLPTTAGAFQTGYGGGSLDGFVTKVNANGSALVYSTYLGGGDFDDAEHVTLDGSGNAYVTGTTESTDFPTTAGAFDTTGNGMADAFVTKLNNAGSALVYSTYLGGGDWDVGADVTLDSSGNAYVAGLTYSTDFPTTAGAFDTTANGQTQAFVTKLNAAGSALAYSTYLGGSGYDNANSIAVDGAGNAYVTGLTSSTDFPTTAGAFQSSYGGGNLDAFVMKLNATGTALNYSTYLGGSDIDIPNGLALDGSGNVCVTGYTNSTDFPTTAGAFQTVYGGAYSDAFVTKLQIADPGDPVAGAGGPYVFPEGMTAAILEGGAAPGPGRTIVSFEWDLDYDGITFGGSPGGATVNYVPHGDGPWAATIALRVTDDLGNTDLDVTTITVVNVAPTITGVTNTGPVDEGSSVTVTVNATDPAGADDPLQYEFDFDNNGSYEVGPQSNNSASTAYANSGSHAVKVRVTDGDGGSATGTTTVIVNNVPTVTIDQGATQPDPTDIPSVQFDVKFSDPVTDFGPADVSLAGTTAGGPLAVAVAGSGDTYTVTVTGMMTGGLVVASIPAGGVTDAAGNPNAASTSTDNSVAYWDPGTLGFAQAVYATTEDAATHAVTITVTRAGRTDGIVSIDYATGDGTAHAGTDYTATSDTLSWADGVGGDKSFTIPILSDVLNEGQELIYLTLTNPSGSAGTPGLGLTTATVAIAPSDGQGPGTYLDQDGDKYKIRLGGKTGTLQWFRTDPDGDGRGPIELIELTGTLPDPLKPRASLAISVAKAKTTADAGTVGLGALTGSGLKGISARKATLNGDGITLNGYLGSLTIGDIVNGADVTAGAGATPQQKTRISALAIGYGTAIDVGAPISSLAATSFGAGSVTAPGVGTLTVKGNMAADVTVTGVGVDPTKKALGLLRVKGAVTGSNIVVTGNVGTVVVGAFRESRLFAGYAGPDDGSGAFNLPATVGTFRATDIFDGFQDSRVIATAFKAVSIANYYDSPDVAGPFGFYADVSLGAITVTAPTRWKYDAARPTPQGVGDFEVKIV